MGAVWKDDDIVLNVSGATEYVIEQYDQRNWSREEIYRGVAMPKPNTDYVTIRLSDFAKNICNSDVEGELFNDMGYSDALIPYYHTELSIIYNNNSKGKAYYNSYDYNNDEDLGYVNFISKPIIPYSNRGYVLLSFYNADNDFAYVGIRKKGTDEMYYIEINIDPFTGYIVSRGNMEVGEYEIYGSTMANQEMVKIGEFKVVDRCNRYNLHYVNAMGGYSTLPIEGLKDKRTDSFEYNYYKTRGSNQSYTDYQMHKFQTNITPKWELQTGWLNDEQSKQMYHLFGSQKVWLEDIEEGKIYPVYITNNSVDYKTFTNNGKKKVSYTISVTSANTIVKH